MAYVEKHNLHELFVDLTSKCVLQKAEDPKILIVTQLSSSFGKMNFDEKKQMEEKLQNLEDELLELKAENSVLRQKLVSDSPKPNQLNSEVQIAETLPITESDEEKENESVPPPTKKLKKGGRPWKNPKEVYDVSADEDEPFNGFNDISIIESVKLTNTLSKALQRNAEESGEKRTNLRSKRSLSSSIGDSDQSFVSQTESAVRAIRKSAVVGKQRVQEQQDAALI